MHVLGLLLSTYGIKIKMRKTKLNVWKSRIENGDNFGVTFRAKKTALSRLLSGSSCALLRSKTWIGSAATPGHSEGFSRVIIR